MCHFCALKKSHSPLFSFFRKSFNDGFQISASLIRSVGEEVWEGLLPVASAAIKEAMEAAATASEKAHRQLG